MNRRELLKSTGAIVVGFALGSTRATAQSTKPTDVTELDSFLAIHADGSVTVYCGKVDLGTGLRIAVRQIAAEELGVPLEKVALIEGDTLVTPDQGSTGGSTGLTRGGVEIRQAAATARQAIAAMEASKPGASIADLMAGKTFRLKVDPKAPLKPSSRYTIVGKSPLRPDVPGKCTARHEYVHDFRLPGMLHGRVVRPTSYGAKLQSVEMESVNHIPGVRILRQRDFLAVVAPDEWAAIRASRELKAQWTNWEGLPGSGELEKYLRGAAIAQDQEVVKKESMASPDASNKIEATFRWPNQSHGSIGPSCAVADVKGDTATVWSGSQGPHGLRQNLSKVFGIPMEKMRVVYLDSAGCYGGNGNDDAAADAMLMSRLAGAPVRVQWMRQEEHAWDPKGPQQMLDVRAAFDDKGLIANWDVEMWVPAGKPGNRPLLAADAAGIAQDNGQGAGLLTQNGDPAYPAANVRVVAHMVADTPVRPSNLRAPGKIANVFAVESVANEIASRAKMDAVAWRLRGLNDPRARAVIQRAAQVFGWVPRPSPNPVASKTGTAMGRGIAYSRYKQAENYVALIMEVGVDRATGKVQVRRVVAAQDCGLTVNPNALRNQIEGQIVQTLSRALHEEVKFDRSRVTTVDWVTYPILTFPEVPDIKVELIDHPELPLLGAGEATCAPVAAALANAIFDATGAKMRTAPFTSERVLAAIAGA
jgi:nicotinate dehydrogenase subunit B